MDDVGEDLQRLTSPNPLLKLGSTTPGSPGPRRVLSISIHGDSTTSLGNLFQCLTTHSEKLLPVFNRYFSLCPWAFSSRGYTIPALPASPRITPICSKRGFPTQVFCMNYSFTLFWWLNYMTNCGYISPLFFASCEKYSSKFKSPTKLLIEYNWATCTGEIH